MLKSLSLTIDADERVTVVSDVTVLNLFLSWVLELCHGTLMILLTLTAV